MKNLLIAVAACLALATPAAGGAEIVANGDTISITGEIKQGDDIHLLAAVTPQTRIVILNSLGGELYPALAMGRLVRAHKIKTVIPDGAFCASACSMIWLGGVPRDIHGNGRLGFHSARPKGQADCRKGKEGGLFICDEQGNDLMVAWLHETELYPVPKDSIDIGGAIGWFLEHGIGLIMGVPPGEIRWLDHADAMELGLIARPDPVPLPRGKP
jgi:hypothetical protein